MRRTGDGVLGTADRDVQLRIVEGTHRHLSVLHMSCDTEQDLADIASRIGAMGVESTIEGTTLHCTDPVFRHRVVVDVGAPHALSPAAAARPQRSGRAGQDERPAPKPWSRPYCVRPGDSARSCSVPHTSPRPPHSSSTGSASRCPTRSSRRRYVRTDRVGPSQPADPAGIDAATNHYLFEVDEHRLRDGKAGTAVVAEREDASVVGVGRHNLGSNIFWYLTDPAGTFFEFFSDMDQIVDDALW